jgi:hypothetical protein
VLSLPSAPSVVFGKIDVPGAQHTIVFYAHYDGQPVTPSEWDGGSPFTPIAREVNGEQRIYARCAGDDKAAIFGAAYSVRRQPRSRCGRIFASCGRVRRKRDRHIWSRYSMPTAIWSTAMSGWYATAPVDQSVEQTVVFGARADAIAFASALLPHSAYAKASAANAHGCRPELARRSSATVIASSNRPPSVSAHSSVYRELKAFESSSTARRAQSSLRRAGCRR